MRTVIFDLDGTLADTSGDLIAAANACFRCLGLGALLDPKRDRTAAFHGGRAMLRLGFERAGLSPSEEEIQPLYQRFLEFYADDIDRTTVLYPGAEAAVETLVSDGYRVGICTNKPEGLAEALMQRLGVRQLFASLVGAGTLSVSKPDPAPYIAAVERAGGAVEQSVLVGDSTTDHATARAAGVPLVFVSFGADAPAAFATAPEAVIDDYDALADAVRRLIG